MYWVSKMGIEKTDRPIKKILILIDDRSDTCLPLLSRRRREKNNFSKNY